MQHILFCTLHTFSKTGGVEKVCRILSKALHENTMQHGGDIEMVSMYDDKDDAKNNLYFPENKFKGFKKNKLAFVVSAIMQGRKFDMILLSHVNLLPVGWVLKKISASTKVVLLTHGIEVWDKLSPAKRMMMNSCDQIFSVSEFTKSKLIEINAVPGDKVKVLNNCLDPFLQLTPQNEINCRKRYGIPENGKILLTLTRLSASERRKGYLNVISALAELIKSDSSIYYIIAGGYDEAEKEVILSHARKLNIKEHIILTGFIADDDIPSLFKQSNVYVMPSKKEGFGIVFIEALYFGLPVIGGNVDGTVDALRNGEYGILVNPDDLSAIREAIVKVLSSKQTYVHPSAQIVKSFGYDYYKEKLFHLLAAV